MTKQKKMTLSAIIVAVIAIGLTMWYFSNDLAHDPKALRELGRSYMLGKGVKQDMTKACEYFQQAAALNDIYSQYCLGVSYLLGQGVEKNLKLSTQWFMYAAMQGYAPAQCNVGVAYFNGYGVNTNVQKSMEWYQKAADQNEPDAIANLAMMYAFGSAGVVDLKLAQEYLNRLPQNNKRRIQGLEILNSPKENPPKAKTGDEFYKLGIFYAQKTLKNYPKAIEAFEKAAEANNIKALNILGYHNLSGIGLTKTDPAKALNYLQKASDLGDSTASLNAGFYYEQGIGVAQNLSKAKALYTKALESSDKKLQTQAKAALERIKNISKK